MSHDVSGILPGFYHVFGLGIRQLPKKKRLAFDDKPVLGGKLLLHIQYFDIICQPGGWLFESASSSPYVQYPGFLNAQSGKLPPEICTVGHTGYRVLPFP
jgi:hypothetical protein